MGAIIPVMSGGGGGGGFGGYPRRQVDNSGAAFLAAMMNGDRYQSRSDPNATLALVLQLAMQKESLAENRRQFDEMLTERGGQFEENMRYLNRTLTEQTKVQGDQFGFLRDQYADQRSDIQDLRRQVREAEERGRAAATAQNAIDALKTQTVASADISQKEKAVQTAATQAAFAEEVGRGLETAGEKVTGESEWLSATKPSKFDLEHGFGLIAGAYETPKSYQGVVDFAKTLEDRALNIKDPAERARFANEASARVGDLLETVKEKGFDTTSPWADINPVSWAWGGARKLAGLPYNAADATFKESAVDRLRSARFLLNKMADPAINERESLKAVRELQGKLGKIESAKAGIQRDISRIGAGQPGASPFAALEAEVPQMIGRYLDDPNASTTTSAQADWSKFHEYATTRPG